MDVLVVAGDGRAGIVVLGADGDHVGPGAVDNHDQVRDSRLFPVEQGQDRGNEFGGSECFDHGFGDEAGCLEFSARSDRDVGVATRSGLVGGDIDRNQIGLVGAVGGEASPQVGPVEMEGVTGSGRSLGAGR